MQYKKVNNTCTSCTILISLFIMLTLILQSCSDAISLVSPPEEPIDNTMPYRPTNDEIFVCLQLLSKEYEEIQKTITARVALPLLLGYNPITGTFTEEGLRIEYTLTFEGSLFKKELQDILLDITLTNYIIESPKTSIEVVEPFNLDEFADTISLTLTGIITVDNKIIEYNANIQSSDLGDALHIDFKENKYNQKYLINGYDYTAQVDALFDEFL